jgi:hypothetical protein
MNWVLLSFLPSPDFGDPSQKEICLQSAFFVLMGEKKNLGPLKS